MFHSLSVRFFIVVALVLAIPISPLYASMISTERVVAGMAEERERIRNFVQRTDVQKKIVALGVSPTEANARVASLSDAEVAKISGQLDRLPVGGDGIYLGLGALVLIAILVILLIRR